ncbi:hypothetical protein EDC04DRAFT_2747799, partial [Pisolithus marmoratus]
TFMWRGRTRGHIRCPSILTFNFVNVYITSYGYRRSAYQQGVQCQPRLQEYQMPLSNVLVPYLLHAATLGVQTRIRVAYVRRSLPRSQSRIQPLAVPAVPPPSPTSSRPYPPSTTMPVSSWSAHLEKTIKAVPHRNFVDVTPSAYRHTHQQTAWLPF